MFFLGKGGNGNIQHIFRRRDDLEVVDFLW